MADRRNHREAAVVRSPFCPPGQMFVFDLPDESKTIVLPPTVSDETFAKCEQAVERHNAFGRDMDYLS